MLFPLVPALCFLALLWVSPVGAAEPPPLDSERFGEIVAKLENSLAELPVPEAVAEWTRTARYATWAGANASTMTEFVTPEAAAERAAEIRAQGFNAVMVSGRHYRQGYRDPASMEPIVKSLRLAVEACHAEGLKVIDHNDVTVYWSGAYERVFENPDWVQVDVRHGAPLRWFCLTNAEFTADAVAYLRNLLEETGVDGFMTDEVTFRPESCGCLQCRNGFERDTGYRLPEDSSSATLFAPADPLWRLWQYWRSVSVRRFHREIVAALQEENPEVLWLGYSTAFTGPGAGDGGADMFDRSQVLNYPGYEAINTTYPAALHLHSELRVRLGAYRPHGRPHGRFGWTQFPTGGTDGELEFAAMLSAVAGHSVWSSSRTGNLGTLFNTEHWDSLTKPRGPAADVAVIFSPATRDGEEALALLHEAELLGFGQALLRRGVAYEVLVDIGLKGGDLAPFRVVIVPAMDAISPDLSGALVDFAREGGGVVVTGDAGRRDQYGFAAGNALREALGLGEVTPHTPPPPRKPGEAPPPSPATVQFSAGREHPFAPQSPVAFAEVQSYATGYDSINDNEVLARFASHEHPAAVIRGLGSGRLVHLAFLPGRAVYEPKLAMGNRITRRSDPLVDAMIESLVLTAAAGRVSAVQGEGVMSAIYAAPHRRVVHLLNVGGISLPEDGEILDASAAIPRYPAVGPVEITLRYAARSARFHKPGLEEPMDLPLHREGDLLRIELPAGSFERYAAVEVLE